MESLGAIIKKEESSLIIKGILNKDNKVNLHREIDCNESGSTLRFLVPISLLFEGESRFIGRGNLGKRPLDTYYEIFDNQGIEFSYVKDILDLKIKGKLRSSEFRVRGDISSQFISGLLFALPLLEGNSKIIITTNMESKGYIDLTLDTMKDFGVNVINNNYKEFIIEGNQSYKPNEYEVEGDYSQAAFYIVSNMLGSKIKLLGLKKDSKQGDKEIIEIAKRFGATIKEENNSLLVEILDGLKATDVDAKNCPDIIPVVAVLASVAKGRTTIYNAKRLRIKECDRLNAIATELKSLGAKVIEEEDRLIIDGVDSLDFKEELWSYKDHRISMALAIASGVCKNEIIIRDYDCVSKSYPGFYEDFKNLGGVLWDQHGEVK